MRFVINTKYNQAGRRTLNAIEKRLVPNGHSIDYDVWEGIDRFDVVIFMAPDSKIREVKQKHPNLLCGLFDPKAQLSWQVAEARAADFLVVSSLEQKDFFLQYNKNIFIYYQFPDTPEIQKIHTKKEKIIIGYHGNKQHLDAMDTVAAALDNLAEKYDIELWAIYNIEKLGKWNLNVPGTCPVRHIQWSEEAMNTMLPQCDIGIQPSVLSVSRFWSRPLRSFLYNPEGYNKNDYVHRFKYSNNPGRIYVFSQYFLPIVTDFTPSSCEFIRNGETGFLAGTEAGWVHALEQLIIDHELRNKCSKNLFDFISASASIDKNFEKLIGEIKNLYEKCPT